MKNFLSRINNFFLSAMSVLKSSELFAVKQSPSLEVSSNGSGAKHKRRNNAILMMYSGWGYYGMQRGPIYPTIEGELSKALFTCGQLVNVTSEEHKKVNFQRASKTDKYVSALGQVCSLKLYDDADLLNKLNTALPQDIRILDIIRVTRSFSSYNSCTHRVYDYLLPTFALSSDNLSLNDSTCWTYRVTAEKITKLNNLLERYKGTHNFYNFTSGRLPTDKSCYRHIKSVECIPTFLLGEHEYTVIRIIGQSFMLHQVRKMIGLVLGILRGYATEDVFDIVFCKERVDIPKAPGLGLMLNQVDFSCYNKKYQNDGIHQPLDWSKYEDQRNEFMMQYVYQHIDQIETEDKSMLQWLATLNCHTYSFRDSSSPTIVDDKVSETDDLQIVAIEETTLHTQSNTNGKRDYDDSDKCDLPVKKERMEL
ncbi:tRNA pseudouridine synthase A isoform 1 [Schistosoma japonicum]|uniref:Pseudouridylate synthase 1 homolog n=1 Tax=Schistosoma japonicum TaxID=6182 RepID=A0A4Z2CRJ1_SCHJA|nr:tRNA pseudouridine synthase A isoform 1 [Schistosoma japonicum]TNN06842.1 tRNA pseudouridine synthase A isoform 1 [Schistosoma japonicum]